MLWEHLKDCLGASLNTWPWRGWVPQSNDHVTGLWFIAMPTCVYRAPSGDPILIFYEQKLKSKYTLFWTQLSPTVDFPHLENITRCLVPKAHANCLSLEGPSHTEQLCEDNAFPFPRPCYPRVKHVECSMLYQNSAVEWNPFQHVSELLLAISQKQYCIYWHLIFFSNYQLASNCPSNICLKGMMANPHEWWGLFFNTTWFSNKCLIYSRNLFFWKIILLWRVDLRNASSFQLKPRALIKCLTL